VAISMPVVMMKTEIATSAGGLLAITHEHSPAVRAPTHYQPGYSLQVGIHADMSP